MININIGLLMIIIWGLMIVSGLAGYIVGQGFRRFREGDDDKE